MKYFPYASKTKALAYWNKISKVTKIIFAIATPVTVIVFWVAMLLPEAASNSISTSCSGSDNIAVIRIRGDIVEDEGVYAKVSTAAETVLRAVDQIKNMPNIRALIIDINSEGGNAVAGDEIAKSIRSVAGKDTIAVIHGSGLSAGYLIASAAGKVYADAYSAVGDIGITLSYVDDSAKYTNEGLVYQSISSGKYKDAFAPGHQLTQDERAMLMKQVNDSAAIMVEQIAEYRGKTSAEIAKLADASTYNGHQAQELGLVDEVGGLPDAVQALTDAWGVQAKQCEINGSVAPKTLSDGTVTE